MATLTIRNVDPETQKRLRIRAAHNGRSMEAELRAILNAAVTVNAEPQGANLADEIHSYFAAVGGVDLEPHPPTPVREPPDFGDDRT